MKHKIYILFLLLPIALMPFYVVRFSFLGLPTTLLEALILMAFIIGIFWVGPKQLVCMLRQLPRWFCISICLFLISSFLGVLAAPDFIKALGEVRAYVWEPLFYTLLLYGLIHNRLISLRQVLYALSFPVLCLTIMSFWQFITKEDPFAPYEIAQGRVSAIYNSANALSLFLTPVLPLFFSLFFIIKERLRFYWFFVFIMGVLTLFMTGSEAGFLAFIVSFFIYFLLTFLRSLKVSLVMQLFSLLFWGGVIATLLFLFLTVPRLAPEFTQVPLTRVVSSTYEVRLCLWEGATNVLKESPFLGAGAAGFQEAYRLHLTCDSELLLYAHNTLLDVWLAFGFLGLVAYLLLLYKSLCNLLVKYFKEKRMLFLGFFAAFIAYLVQGLFDVPYFKNDLSLLFWLLVILTLVLSEGVAHWTSWDNQD